DPTPQAMPNMVRNDRSLWAHRVRKIWAKMSIKCCMAETNYHSTVCVSGPGHRNNSTDLPRSKGGRPPPRQSKERGCYGLIIWGAWISAMTSLFWEAARRD